MDDAAFERWSQSLEALRLSRKMEWEQALQEKVDSFKPAEFYPLALRSIETVMERWLSFEQESPPVTSAKALQNIKAEMESIFEFELESIARDAAMITSRITWRPEELDEAQKKFFPLADEIRKKYQIKLKTLSPGEIKNPFPSEPLRAVQYSGSSSRSGGGLSSIAMLLVGLLMGGGVSVYFKDSEHKAVKRGFRMKNRRWSLISVRFPIAWRFCIPISPIWCWAKANRFPSFRRKWPASREYSTIKSIS